MIHILRRLGLGTTCLTAVFAVGCGGGGVSNVPVEEAKKKSMDAVGMPPAAKDAMGQMGAGGNPGQMDPKKMMDSMYKGAGSNYPGTGGPSGGPPRGGLPGGGAPTPPNK